MPIRPVPPKVQHALNLLFISGVVSLVATLPQFAPENIFRLTESRLQTPPDVLFNRLRLIRPLTSDDEILRSRFQSVENRLAYLAFGPDTVINCIWCTTNTGAADISYFLTYTLPKVLAPHLLNMVVLGLVTSGYIVGPEGSRFRIHAIIAGLALVVSETWYLAAYDITANKRAPRLQDIDFLHWKLRVYRYLSFAALHGLLGLLLWATSTNRWFATPPSLALRLEAAARAAEDSVHKIRALGLMTNSVNRDAALRGVKEEYWQTEGQVMADVIQEDEVVGEINRVLGIMDLKQLEGQAGSAADAILKGIDNLGVPNVSA